MTRPIVLAGGGTGGHVLPIRAIVEALLAEGVRPEDLVVVGSRRGNERQLLGDLGVELVLLPGRGLLRSAHPRALARNAGAAVQLIAAAVRAVALVGRRRVRAVVSVGGYAAFGAGLGAVLWRRPLVLVDLDATPGLVNRVLRRFATAITAALPGDPDPRTVVTGAPVRAEVARVTRTAPERLEARHRLGLGAHGDVVAIVSGSLGAGSVNRAACDLAVRWRDRETTTLYHVTGARDEATVRARKREAGIGDSTWHVVGFEHHIADLWSACDVAVSRAGANTVAELCVTGVPSVLVALPGAPGDHQGHNAAVLAAAGAAVVLDDATLSGEELDAALSSLLADPERLVRMSDAARALARPDAAHRVAEVVLDRAK